MGKPNEFPKLKPRGLKLKPRGLKLFITLDRMEGSGGLVCEAVCSAHSQVLLGSTVSTPGVIESAFSLGCDGSTLTAPGGSFFGTPNKLTVGERLLNVGFKMLGSLGPFADPNRLIVGLVAWLETRGRTFGTLVSTRDAVDGGALCSAACGFCVLFPGSEAGSGTFGIPCVLGPFADPNISIGGLRKPDSVESSAREELIPSKLRVFTFGTLLSIMLLLLHLGVGGVLSSEDVSPEVVSAELNVRDFCISPHEKPVQLGLVIA